MRYASVSSVFIDKLAHIRNVLEIPVIADLLKKLRIEDGHEDLIAAWQKTATHWGFGVETSPRCEVYENHGRKFVQEVVDSIRAQMAA